MPQPSYIINLYDSLLNAPDERAKARIIATAFEELEDRYPELRDLATAGGVRESELRLQKEIEQVRADLTERIEQVRADLTERIEQVRTDLTVRIEQVRADLIARIEQVRTDLTRSIHETKTELQAAIHKGNMTVLRWTVSLLMVQIFTILVAVFTVILK